MPWLRKLGASVDRTDAPGVSFGLCGFDGSIVEGDERGPGALGLNLGPAPAQGLELQVGSSVLQDLPLGALEDPPVLVAKRERRFVAVAMKIRRPYRSALGIDQAMAEIRDDDGTRAAARLVVAWIEVFERCLRFEYPVESGGRH